MSLSSTAACIAAREIERQQREEKIRNAVAKGDVDTVLNLLPHIDRDLRNNEWRWMAASALKKGDLETYKKIVPDRYPNELNPNEVKTILAAGPPV